jgi:hypothetical protein
MHQFDAEAGVIAPISEKKNTMDPTYSERKGQRQSRIHVI